MTKATYSEISAVAKEFSRVTVSHFESHSYACGAFEAMLSHVVADLPKHKQAEILRNLQTLTAKYAK
jgi:hypothetical protein